MKNEKKLIVLVAENDKANVEQLKKSIKTNVKANDITVQAIDEVDGVVNEIKKSETKPNVVILSEPAQGKTKFTSEILSRIGQIKKVSPTSEVVVLSTPTTVENAIETFRAGAFDVISKDGQTSKNVVNSLHRYLETTDRTEELSAARKQTAFISSH